MQRRVAFNVAADACTAVQQQVHNVPHLVSRGYNQRRQALLVDGVDIGPAVEQQHRRGQRLVGARYVQWRPIVLVFGGKRKEERREREGEGAALRR